MKNILIIGLGRFGSALVRPMSELGNQVVVCDIDEENIAKVLPFTAGAKIGDCTNEKFIASLGVEDFDMVFVTIGESIQSSLVAVTLLKDNGAKCICAKAGSEMHEKLLLRLGADKVFFPERDAGIRVANIYGRESVFECITLDEGYSVYEIAVPAEWIGRSVKTLNVRANYGVNIIGIKRSGDKAINPSVSPDYCFAKGDVVMLVGDAERFTNLMK
ncbi:MAG: TrkA family potassium uptake protein [Clostridia bacterium]|nr:TrkA family potassium uptake protein [Clostridia bacterium]